eukprot:365049-Chlamydomonas_euryale.AAC.5
MGVDVAATVDGGCDSVSAMPADDGAAAVSSEPAQHQQYQQQPHQQPGRRGGQQALSGGGAGGHGDSCGNGQEGAGGGAETPAAAVLSKGGMGGGGPRLPQRPSLRRYARRDQTQGGARCGSAYDVPGANCIFSAGRPFAEHRRQGIRRHLGRAAASRCACLHGTACMCARACSVHAQKDKGFACMCAAASLSTSVHAQKDKGFACMCGAASLSTSVHAQKDKGFACMCAGVQQGAGGRDKGAQGVPLCMHACVRACALLRVSLRHQSGSDGVITLIPRLQPCSLSTSSRKGQ